MAKLYVTEFKQVGASLSGGGTPHLYQPGLDQTPVVIGAGSLQSAAFATSTTFVEIHTDAICSIAIGINPTATVNTSRMAANETRRYAVKGGDQVAVIANT